jgi:hypothetical protein
MKKLEKKDVDRLKMIHKVCVLFYLYILEGLGLL